VNSSQLDVSVTDQRPQLPTGVRLIAVGIALVAIGGGVLICGLTLLLLSLMNMDTPPADQQPGILILLALGSGAAPAIGGLVVARGLWAGASWAKLAAQIIFACLGASVGFGLLRQALNPQALDRGASLAPEYRMIALAMAAGCLAAAVYLQSPKVRTAFGPERVGGLGGRTRQRLLVGIAFVALVIVAALAVRP
jgi:hypothetical protein